MLGLTKAIRKAKEYSVEDLDFAQRSITWFELGGAHGQSRVTVHYERVKPLDPFINPHSDSWHENSKLAAPLRMKRRIDFRLPIRNTFEYYRRHSLTLNDVKWILECASLTHVWHCAIYDNTPLSNAAIKPSPASPDEISYGGKGIAITKMIKAYQEKYHRQLSQSSSRSALQWPLREGLEEVCSIELEQTKFPLPFHNVCARDWEALNNGLAGAQQACSVSSSWFNPAVLVFPHCWKWSNIYVVPLRKGLYKGREYMLMGRIVPRELYVKWHDANPCIAEMRDCVIVDHQQYFIVDETFYVYCDSLEEHILS